MKEIFKYFFILCVIAVISNASDLKSANTLNVEATKSKKTNMQNFEKNHKDYIDKLMKQVSEKLDNASKRGSKGIGIFISDLKGFTSIENYDDFREYLEEKLKKAGYKTKRAHDYIEIYW